MNLEQLQKAIIAKFDHCRIVFWQDEDVEFRSSLDEFTPQFEAHKIQLIQLDDASHFEVKYQIESLSPKQKFLLYSNKSPNEPARDWLYDIRLYAEHFYADSSSMLLTELGMRLEFRHDVSKHKRFFANQSRLQRLKRILPEDADKHSLELSMIAVLLKLETLSVNDIVNHIIGLYSQDEDALKGMLTELAKFNLLPIFWQAIASEFGFINEHVWAALVENEVLDDYGLSAIKDLITKLLVTDCYHGLKSSGVTVNKTKFLTTMTIHLLPMKVEDDALYNLPVELRDVFLNSSSKRAAVVSFVQSWRDNRVLSSTYNILSEQVANTLEINTQLAEFKSPDQLLAVETFEVAEQQFITQIAKNLTAYSLNDVNDWISKKLRSHWVVDTSFHAHKNYACIYRALRAARELYALREKYIDGFDFSSAKSLYKAYETELWQFDHAYRIFSENSIAISKYGADILKGSGLVDDIESIYVEWYLHDLAVAWGRCVDDENLLENWQLPSVNNQYQFFNEEVKGTMAKSQLKRVFVIISDALRYEVAHDIHQQINDEKRFKSEIKSQLGVVPSYTQLGMASLLPHSTISANTSKKPEYKIDGQSVHGHDNRHKILAAHNGIAFKADEVLSWTNKEGRDKVKEAQVVYIYHDEIDAIGDKQATENQTFEAARDAVDEIKQLIGRIINRLNGSRVIVTADHGFLFKMTDVTEQDKTALKAMPSGAIEAKKRYIIGENLPNDSFYWTGYLSKTANVESDSNAQFMIPKGSNRFNFVGGAKFIHGGIMPQEICVPILHVRELDTKGQQKHAKQKVTALPLQNPVKLVSNIDSIMFLQADPVNSQFKSRELSIWIESPDEQQVSSKETVLFDSTSEKMDERQKKVQIKLEGSSFDRTLSYKLVMEDTETKIRSTHSVIIDIAFENDFF